MTKNGLIILERIPASHVDKQGVMVSPRSCPERCTSSEGA